jgi:hypothetical protein
MSYFGHYKSTTTSQNGCIKEFVTVGNTTVLFPPQVQYECTLCKKVHGFRFVKPWLISSEKQKKDFIKYCVDNSIETEVSIG